MTELHAILEHSARLATLNMALSSLILVLQLGILVLQVKIFQSLKAQRELASRPLGLVDRPPTHRAGT